jgi:LemA protein
MSWALLGGAVFVMIIMIGEYSRLVQLRNRADSLRLEMEAHLRRRHDLILNLSEALRGPGLQSAPNLGQLQMSLNQTEETIRDLRLDYNAVAGNLNARIQAFPINLVAGRLGLRSRQVFELPDSSPAPVATLDGR